MFFKELKKQVAEIIGAIREQKDEISKIKTQLLSAQLLNKAYLDIIERETAKRDEQIKGIAAKLDAVAGQYYETVQKILEFNKEVFIKEVFLSGVKDKEFENFRAGLVKPLLENKWAAEKNGNGAKIINKGVAVIEERDRLHAEILVKERQGENVEALKEQMKAFEWIVAQVTND